MKDNIKHHISVSSINSRSYVFANDYTHAHYIETGNYKNAFSSGDVGLDRLGITFRCLVM